MKTVKILSFSAIAVLSSLLPQSAEALPALHLIPPALKLFAESSLYVKSATRLRNKNLRPRPRGLENWMSHPVISSSRIGDLTFPASHNAHAYYTHGPYRFVPFLKDYIRTQRKDIFDQLMNGIRVLDIRPFNATRNAHGGFLTSKHKEIAGGIAKFLKASPSELVIVYVSTQTSDLSEHNRRFGYTVDSVNQALIDEKVPALILRSEEDITNFKNETVAEVIDRGVRVVLIPVGEGKLPRTCNISWHTTKDDNVDGLIPKLWRDLSERSSSRSKRFGGLFYVLNAQRTVSGSAEVAHILGGQGGYDGTARQIARSLAGDLEIRENAELMRRANFVMMDHVQHSELTEKLIQINQEGVGRTTPHTRIGSARAE